MQYTKENLSEKNKFKFAITVEAETLKQCHDKGLRSLAKDVKVPGFRKGHIPMEVLERAVDPAKLADLEINDAINLSMIELVQKEDLQILDQPVVEVTKYVPANVLEFSATIEVVPPVKLADPTKLKAKLAETKVDSKSINEVVERLRTSAATKTAVERAAKSGDEVVIDFTGLVDGKEFAGGKATDYNLTLGSGSFIPGFEDGIVGHKPGESFDVNVTFPVEYGAKELAGKAAIFRVELKKVNELALPKLDAEFAKSIAPDFLTMDDLRADIEKELAGQEEQSNRQKYQDELLAELGEKSKVEVPEVLVDDQMPAMEQQFIENLMYRGMSLDSYLEQNKMTKDEWTESELRPAAKKRVRNSMILTQLARDYDIQVTSSEIDDYQARIVARYNDAKMKAQFESSEARRQIGQQLVTEKTLAKLMELAGK